MRFLLAVIALLIGTTNAQTVSIGVTHAYLQSSGTWWQQEFEHSLPKDVPSVGIRYDKRNGENGWGVGYMFVGRFRSTAKAIASDWYYNDWDKKSPPTYPLSTWIGDEQVHAAFLVARHYNGKAYFEAGPVLTYSRWTMHIPDWRHCIDPACKVAGDPQPLTVGRPKQWHFEIVTAAGYQITQNLGVSLSFYPTHISGEFPGITQGYSPAIHLNYTF